VLGLIALLALGEVALLALGEGGDNSVRIAFGVGTLVLIIILIAALLVRSTVRVWARRTSHRTHIQLLRFAESNGFDYIAGPVGAQRDMPWRSRGSLNLHRVLRSRTNAA
jgi:hypothetical protein